MLRFFWAVSAYLLTRCLSILSVLVVNMVVSFDCCIALCMVACLRFIHGSYFSRTCSGVHPVFGRIIRRVPVLYSSRGLSNLMLVAPGKGFEPLLHRNGTGLPVPFTIRSRGRRFNRSATPAASGISARRFLSLTLRCWAPSLPTHSLAHYEGERGGRRKPTGFSRGGTSGKGQ